MKPFDIELARKGHKVQTRDGRAVTILTVDAKNDTYPVVALVPLCGGETPQSFTKEGNYRVDKRDTGFDLFMAPTTKVAYANLYKSEANELPILGMSYRTKAEAKAGKERVLNKYIKTIKIEWEE